MINCIYILPSNIIITQNIQAFKEGAWKLFNPTSFIHISHTLDLYLQQIFEEFDKKLQLKWSKV